MVEQTALAAQELPLPPEKPSPNPVKKRLKEAGGLVLCVAFGFAIALGPMRYLPELSLLHLLAALILLPLMLWLQLLLHEAGHVIAGTACGKRLLAAGVGPWRVERKENGWQLRRVSSIQGIGGFAILLPPNAENEARWKNALYILGGPAANLLSAALATMLYVSLSEQSLLLQLALFIFIGTGLLLGVINLLPLVSGGWHSDGKNLLLLFGNNPDGDIQQATRQLMSMTAMGTRPAEFPTQLLPPESTAETPDALRRFSNLVRLEWAIDSQKQESADRLAPQLADDFWAFPDGQRQGVAALMCAWLLVFHHDTERFQVWREHTEGGVMNLQALLHWLDAKAASLEGNVSVSRRHLQTARNALPELACSGDRNMLAAWIDTLEKELATQEFT